MSIIKKSAVMIHIFPFKFAAEYVCNERNKRLNEPPDELIIDGTYGDERAEVQRMSNSKLSTFLHP